jgi:hypothetical protein
MLLTEEEFLLESISDEKLDKLNQGFVKMTRITHAFGGEVRDMLFDDKGCVFIAVFGAHNTLMNESIASPPPGGGKGGLLKSSNSRRNVMAGVLSESSELRATKAGKHLVFQSR